MNIHLDIDLLRTFVIAADIGVLSRAAERVGRTQAAISMQIKRLEDNLREPLLIRSGRGVALTLHGERLLVHARKILRAHDDAVTELSGLGLSGSLRFGVPDDYATTFLPSLLQSFAEQHPQVLIEVVCAPTPRLLERLISRTLDIALISEAAPFRSENVLRQEALVWVGMKGGNAVLRHPLQLALSDPDTLDHMAAIASLEKAGRAYRVAYSSGSIAGLTAVIRSGQAVAVLTQSAVPADLQIIPASSGLPPLPSIGIRVAARRGDSSLLRKTFEAHVTSALK